MFTQTGNDFAAVGQIRQAVLVRARRQKYVLLKTTGVAITALHSGPEIDSDDISVVVGLHFVANTE